MENKSYSTTVLVDQSPLHVFNAISEVPQWWTKDFEGNSKAIHDEFIIHHPGMHYSKHKLIEVKAGSKIVWLVTESILYWLPEDRAEWTNTKMIFEISEKAGKTVLHFTHEGLIPEQKCYTMCAFGWDLIIKSWLPYFINHSTASPDMNRAAEIRDQAFGKNSVS
jgi:hypothetical protein